MAMQFDLTGQGWLQLQELLLAFLLSALVGLERELRQKSAGLRTYTLVGVSSALIMLISKYGFNDVLQAQRVVLDPSRVVAQVVSGIGFIGGGVIFMRRNAVRGLTTAASIWLVAALGMACGAGLPLLAIATTIIHVVVMFVFPRLVARLPRERRSSTRLRISYEDGRGLLRRILTLCSSHRFVIDQVEVEREARALTGEAAQDEADWQQEELRQPRPGSVTLLMELRGKRSIETLLAALSEMDGVIGVGTIDADTALD